MRELAAHGAPSSRMKRVVPAALLLMCALAGVAQAFGSATPSEEAAESVWPQRIEAGDETITVYQPDVESWVGTRLTGRVAIAVETKAAAQANYGVIWFTARTEVDKAARLVTLEGVEVTKATFPTQPDPGSATLAAIRSDLRTALHMISLDRLQASLRVDQAEAQERAPRFRNDPPRVLVSSEPAVLILVDGKPVLRAVPGTSLLRVINTRAPLALDPQSGRYDVWLSDRWLQAPSLDGPWTVDPAPSAGLESMKASLADSREVDLLDDPSPDVKALLRDGGIPKIYVSTGPAELLQTRGKPELASIPGTNLLEVTNTASDVFVDTKDNQTYVLISGRWFRAPGLDGPWSYVGAGQLPADFAAIPENHPKGRVLASVAGTPQAREAVIANQIPQTAAIQRGGVQFQPRYDGTPKFAGIPGTPLLAAANTPSAVIEVNDSSYYGCENGVWFAARSPVGTWSVATSVPEVIYTIPPSSSLYPVTFVRVYDSTPDVVFVGYTPGYYGTYVAPDDVVVFGTGYRYDPWIGGVWIGEPLTYGFGAGYCWGATSGFMLGFTAGELFDPWWGPWGWGRGWGWRHHPRPPHPWQHRDLHAFNQGMNAYHHWGAGVIQRSPRLPVGRGARGAEPGLFSGRDGGIYRPGSTGWERHEAGNWRSVGNDHSAMQQSLDHDASTRAAGDASARDFQSHDFGREPFGERTMGGRDFGHGFGGGLAGGDVHGSGGGGFHGGGSGGGGGGGRR